METKRNSKKRIAVLSDIHGNYVALEKCVRYVLDRGITEFIFLGDYVAEMPYPQKTMEILYALMKDYKCHFIRGNKEDYWISYEAGGEKGWEKYDSTTGALYYAYYGLTDRDKEFFKSLSISDRICIDDFPPIRACHGSPYNVNEKLLNGNDRTKEIMDACEETLILCGHSHIREKIEHNGKVVLNAGSVGLSLKSGKGGQAQFLLLEFGDDGWEYEFVSLDYDAEKIISEMDVCGLKEYAPHWTTVIKYILSTGESSPGTVLGRAMELCRQDLGECIWPKIPEKYWAMAVEELLK